MKRQSDSEFLRDVARKMHRHCTPAMGFDGDDIDLMFHVAECYDQMLEALSWSLNFIESTESELGIKLSTGDRARTAIAKAKGKGQ